MYTDDEKRSGVPIKTFVLSLILIVLFILLLMWLLPIPKNSNNNNNNEINNNGSNSELPNINGLLNRIFIDNVDSMKNAAIFYFTTDKLPTSVGQSVTLTLQEMLDKHLLLPFTDKNGNSCDTKASYVTLTKLKDSFEMKVNLKCGDEEAYILVPIGCYSYCQTAVCQNKERETIVVPVTPNNVDNKGDEKPILYNPSCKLYIAEGTLGENGWYKSDAVVSFKSKFANSKGATIVAYGLGTVPTHTYNSTNALIVSGEGATTVYGYVKDSNGYVSTCSIVVKKDTAKPSCDLSVLSGVKSSNGVFVSDVVVGFANKVDSISGIANYGLSNSSVVTYNGNTSYTITKDGTHTVYGFIKDYAGNTATCDLTVKREKPSTPIISTPSCTLKVTDGKAGTNGWYVGNVTIGFATKTSTNGATITSYGLGMSETYAGNNSYVVNKDGTTTVYGYVKDSNGYTSSCNITVKKDATKPACEVGVLSGTKNSSGIYTSNIVLGFTSKTDTTSGIANYGMTNTTTAVYNGATKYNIASDGKKTIYGHVIDKAGNTAICSVTVERKKPVVSTPSCTLKVTDGKVGTNGWYVGNVTIGFATKTSTNGATITSYGLGTSETYAGNNSYVVNKDGTTTVYGYVKDSNGYTTSCNITVKKDATKPACEVGVLSGTKDSSGIYTSNIVLGFTSKTDTTSGIANYGMTNTTTAVYNGAAKYNIASDGKKTIYGHVIDKAGNTATCSITVERKKPTSVVSTPSCTLKVTDGKAGTNGWYVGNVTIGFATKTSTNGATITSYGLGTSETYAGNNSYVVNKDGTTTVYGYVKDSNGYTTSCNITVKKDATKPTCEIKVTKGSYNKTYGYYISNVTVGFASKTDTTSGITAYGVGTSKNYNGNTTYTINSIGTTTAYGYVKDYAGNESVCSITVEKRANNVEYEYKKDIATQYSNWSGWTTSTYSPSNPPKFGKYALIEIVDLGKTQEVDYYKKELGQAFYKDILVKVGTATQSYCSGYDYYRDTTTATTTAVQQGSGWNFVGTITTTGSPTDTIDEKYEFVGFDWTCTGCELTPRKIWNKYTRTIYTVQSPSSVTTTSGIRVECSKTETKTIEIYDTVPVFVDYEIKQVPVYKDVYKYQKRTRSVIKEAYTDYQWSYYNNRSLLDNGYVYTNATRPIG